MALGGFSLLSYDVLVLDVCLDGKEKITLILNMVGGVCLCVFGVTFSSL